MRLVLRILPFVVLASLKNRVRAQVRRLRQPRYALATAVGLAWFWFYAGRHLVAGPRRVGTIPPGLTAPLTLGFAAGATLLFLLAWIFRARHQALAMSEAEVQLLFPAPLSRRDVLHFRALQLLARGLVGTLVTTLLFGRAATGSPLRFALGAWIAFATADLHRLGIALTWAAVGEGWAGVRKRIGTFALLAGAVLFTAWAVTQVELPPLGPLSRGGASGLEWFAAATDAALDSPLRIALWPALTLAGLVLARTTADFLAHLPGALALLALHYAWVVRSGVAFEEAALEASERRARAREAFRLRRSGAPVRKGRRRPPFALAPTGRPEPAFVWKALIATGWSRITGAPGVVLGAALVALLAWMATPSGRDAGEALGVLALAAWGSMGLFAPLAIRADLRLDRERLDLLRALPVSGTTVVRGAILGAAVPVLIIQWALLPVAALGFARENGGPTVLWLTLAAAVAGPAVSLVQLVLQNAVIVLLPGWVPREGERGGPEAIGMRLVVAIGGLLALSLLVLPAAGVALAVAGGFWVALDALPAPAVALSALAGAAVLLAEVAIATRLLGAAFDRLDPSEG